MNDTKRYLDHLTRETADTVTGKILQRNGDGTYLYKDLKDGARRFAAGRVGEEFAVGARVRIDRPSASRAVVGSQDVIVNRAPREQRGVSETAPIEDRDEAGRAFIISVDPDPLVLVAGGDAGTQTITGYGFDEAATYFGRGSLPDPTLTDDDAPSVAPETVVMHIAADRDSPRGDFSVAVSGAIATNALRITRPAPGPTYGFLVVGIGANAHTLGTLRDFDGTAVATESADMGGVITRFHQVDNVTYVVFIVGGGGRLVTLDPASGEFTLGALGAHPLPQAGAQIVSVDDLLYYGTDDGRYAEVEQDTGIVVRTLKTYAGSPAFGASAYSASGDALFTSSATSGSGSGETGRRLRRISRASGAETHSILLGATGSSVPYPRVAIIASDGSVIFGMDSSSGTATAKLARYAAADLSFISETTAFNPSPARYEVPVMLRDGTNIFTVWREIGTGGGSRTIRRHDEAITGSAQDVAYSAGYQPGLHHVVIIPAAQNAAGIDILLRMVSVTGGPLVLRSHDAMGAGFATELGDIVCTGFDGTCEPYGFGWTHGAI